MPLSLRYAYLDRAPAFTLEDQDPQMKVERASIYLLYRIMGNRLCIHQVL